MIIMKVAVISCLGLGDGLLALILSNNLVRAGHQAATFHPFLEQAQEWFPHLPLSSKVPDPSQFDRLIFIYEKTPWVGGFFQEALEKHRHKTVVLNPIATPNTDYPYWEEGRFDGRAPFAENLKNYCENQLHIKEATLSNGMG